MKPIFHQDQVKAVLWAKRHLAAAMTLCFGLGILMAGLWGAFENYQLRKVQQQLYISDDQNKRLLNQQAEMTLTTERLRATNQALTAAIREQEQGNRELERGLDFYRKLMDPANAKDGLILQNISIKNISSNLSKSEQRLFKLNLMFVQYTLRRRLMRANLALFLIGENKEGITVEIVAKDIMKNTDKSENKPPSVQNLSFKFFQEIEQVIKLPENFTPRTLRVEAHVKGKSVKKWIKNIAWPDAAIHAK